MVFWSKSIFTQPALQRQDDGDPETRLEMGFSTEAVYRCRCRYGLSGSEAESKDAGARQLESWAGA